MSDLSKEQLADAALEEAAQDAMRLVTDRPHPRMYGAVIFLSANGPRWRISEAHLREQYFRDSAVYWRREATKGATT